MATTTKGFEAAVDEFYGTMSDFALGNSRPAKAVCSHRDDMLLANPFGPAVKGWAQVEPALDYAASRFSEGRVRPADRIATYVSGDLAAIHEVEHWSAKVGGGDPAPFDLRVTSIYRLEEGEWKLVLRHADPISTANDQGPLRAR
jgi:ketosteroid isomerase-like protein